MKEISAVGLRRSLKKVARSLERDGEPFLLKVGQISAGVIVSLKDYREKFTAKTAETERKALMAEIRANGLEIDGDVDAVLSAALDDVRKGA